MNAPSPALVAPRPERLRLVGQRRQMLAVMHQRLMFGMLVFGGMIALIVAAHPVAGGVRRPCRAQGRIDRAHSRARRHRRPRRRAAGADDRCMDHRPSSRQGDRQQARARPPSRRADAGEERGAILCASEVRQDLLLPAPAGFAGPGRAGQRARRARPCRPAGAGPAVSANQPRRACDRLHRRRRPRRCRDGAVVR